MSNHDNAMQIIESRFKLLESGDTSSVVHAELSMAIEMAHSCGVISLEEYDPLVRRQNAIYKKQDAEFIESREKYL